MKKASYMENVKSGQFSTLLEEVVGDI